MKLNREGTLRLFRKHYLKVIIGFVLMIIISLVSGVSVQTLLVSAVLVLLASFSTFYFNYANVPVNFELVKMATILMAYSHGIAAGLIVGIISTIAGKILIGRIDEKLPISIAAIAIVAVAAGVAPHLFSGVSVVWLGIILVGIYNVALFSLSVAMGGDVGWNLPYEGTNFAINFILFTRIAPFLLPLVQSGT